MRIPVIMAILLIIISALVDAYIYGGIVRRKGRRSAWSIAYAVSSILCWAFLAVTLCMPRRSAETDILEVMWMLYSYLSIYVVKIIYLIFSLFGIWPLFKKERPWPTGIFVGLPIGIVCFIAMWYGATVGRNEIQTTRVTVESENLPTAFDGYRIVQFSDAHVGTWGNDTAFISRLVDSINCLKPDVIFFTGDIVNRRTEELKPFVRVFSRLKAKDGVYSILGNHDYGDYVDWDNDGLKKRNLDALIKYQKQMGWTLLNNDRAFITNGNDTIVIIGVENWGEPPFKQYGNLDKAYPYSMDSIYNVNDSRYKILLSHNPEHWNQHVSHETNIDLTLSGHTHAMQIIIGKNKWRWSPSQYIYEQWGGLYNRETKDGRPVRIYVNIGCGEVGAPYRIGATSEITEITLRRYSPNGKD